MRLVRFRADPARVRVTIQRNSLLHHWTVAVGARHGMTPGGYMAQASHHSPARALEMALRRAHDFGVPGIDLEMQWTYPHPFEAT